jgi:hypothetical protein
LNRLASVRFDRVLADAERGEAARVIASAGAKATSWSGQPAASRTYGLLTLAPQTDAQRLGAALQARVVEPPLLVLSVELRESGELEGLREALGGPGGPAGVVDCCLAGGALLVELDEAVTPLSLLVELIDVVLRGSSGRSIVPLFGLSDDTLAAFAAATLGEPALDASRLIEAWLDRLQRAGAAR